MGFTHAHVNCQPVPPDITSNHRCLEHDKGFGVVFQSVERIRSSSGCDMADQYAGLADDLWVLLGLSLSG